MDVGTHVEGRDVIYWFALLVAVNLQTSFLTPPFGFALFYLKGVAPNSVKIQNIYRGIVPFVALQVMGLISVMIWRSEEHTSELQSLMRISYAVFCLTKKKNSIHT